MEVELPGGGERREVVVKLAGYRPGKLVLESDTNGPLEVRLAKQARRRKPKTARRPKSSDGKPKEERKKIPVW